MGGAEMPRLANMDQAARGVLVRKSLDGERSSLVEERELGDNNWLEVEAGEDMAAARYIYLECVAMGRDAGKVVMWMVCRVKRCGTLDGGPNCGGIVLAEGGYLC